MRQLTEQQLRKAKRISRTAFAFGAGATLLINLAHAQPALGPRLGAIVAPICVLFAVEIALVVPTPDSRAARLLKFWGLSLIGMAALIISYIHTAELFMTYGEPPFTAWITPIVPDGMMIAASIALFQLGNIQEQMGLAQSRKALDAETEVIGERQALPSPAPIENTAKPQQVMPVMEQPISPEVRSEPKVVKALGITRPVVAEVNPVAPQKVERLPESEKIEEQPESRPEVESKPTVSASPPEPEMEGSEGLPQAVNQTPEARPELHLVRSSETKPVQAAPATTKKAPVSESLPPKPERTPPKSGREGETSEEPARAPAPAKTKRPSMKPRTPRGELLHEWTLDKMPKRMESVRVYRRGQGKNERLYVCARWNGVDIPETNDIPVAASRETHAHRLADAMLEGAAFSSHRLSTDAEGLTYVKEGLKVSPMTLSKDLRKLGYL